MAFNGIEIDMLSLGDADSILVALWENGRATYILIDGGYRKDAATVTRFLQRRRIEKIDHLVCSHMDNDHAAGLVRLVQEGKFKIGCGWVHQPNLHVSVNSVRETLRKAAAFGDTLGRAAAFEAGIITNSLERQMELAAVLRSRGVTVSEPFEDRTVGFLKVLGPSEEYYEELVRRFTNIERVCDLMEESRAKVAAFNERYKKKSLRLLDEPQLNAENLSSTIMGMEYKGDVILLTGDSGNESLKRVQGYTELIGCRWMQIPHHGSINNITQALVDYFSPTTACVSAEGNEDHPHGAVVQAFKKCGTRVYSTQNNGHLRFRIGDVPQRGNYRPATPL